MGFGSFKQVWRLTFGLALFFISEVIAAQNSYFQQEINYTIDARLNDVAHSLHAKIEVQYINNSNKALDTIYFHLWPNAYKDRNTALCKQLLQTNNSSLYFSKPEERGYIDSLDFKANGESLKWEFTKEYNDVCYLLLKHSLLPHDTLILSTPFYLKIPDAKFSRLGHTGQAYFLTQWYPKPAVFDEDGWHHMPYLDQAEFYSEFGSFDVRITVPRNYLLAATGDRIDSEEEDHFLNAKVQETMNYLEESTRRKNAMNFPPSDSLFKTVRFKQSRVHDFAWFADKRFYVLHDQVQMPLSTRVVDTWVFFTDKNFSKWKNAISYVNEATLFYSHLLGDYPYNHVTAVDGTIMAGGGMEYPNITVIGDVSSELELDITIAHEVGHNWFYGVLGSNERQFPFLDEGLNSFYEMRYARAKYPEKTLAVFSGLKPDSGASFFGLNNMPYWKEKEIAFFTSLKARRDQAINLPATHYSTYNIGASVYAKTALALDYLMDYMGEGNFDEAMQHYYKTFRFKHPKPHDFINALSEQSRFNLQAFDTCFLKSAGGIDYKIQSAKRQADGSYEINVKNKSEKFLAFNVYGYKHNKPVGIVWSDGFDKNKTVVFPPSDVDYFKLDGFDHLPDINRRNNYIKTKGAFKKAKPLQVNFLMKLGDPSKNQVSVLPLVGANFYNGFMLGAAFHNYALYKKRIEFYFSPFYAFQTKSITGFAELDFNFFPKKRIQQVTAGVKVKSFAYDYFNTEIINQNFSTTYKTLYFKFYKIAPFVELELKKRKATDKALQTMRYSSALLFVDSLDSSPITATQGPSADTKFSFVNRLTYLLKNKQIIHPNSLEADLQHTSEMIKLSATFVQQLTLTKTHYFELRLFTGSFLMGSSAEKSYYAFRSSAYSGYQDVQFESNFIARNERNGLGFSQFSETDGNLKVWTPWGQSSTWQAAVNIKSPQFFSLPLRAYVDVVFNDAAFLGTDRYLWDAGINLSLWRDVIEVYFPLWYSKDIGNALELNNVSRANTIRFTVNIHKFTPGKLVQNNVLK